MSGTCPACLGGRLNARSGAVRVQGVTFPEFLAQDVTAGHAFAAALVASHAADKALDEVVAGIEQRLHFLRQTGLGYLTLNRDYVTLSGGESQRVRLATQLGMGLMGVIYVLDEPSIGLHPADNERLLAQLRELRDRGNTVLVLHYDERHYDHQFSREIRGQLETGYEPVFYSPGGRAELWRLKR